MNNERLKKRLEELGDKLRGDERFLGKPDKDGYIELRGKFTYNDLYVIGIFIQHFENVQLDKCNICGFVGFSELFLNDCPTCGSSDVVDASKENYGRPTFLKG